jgi:hypothetical protein
VGAFSFWRVKKHLWLGSLPFVITPAGCTARVEARDPDRTHWWTVTPWRIDATQQGLSARGRWKDTVGIVRYSRTDGNTSDPLHRYPEYRRGP